MIENSLLRAIPRKSYLRLLGELEPVTLTFGDVLYEPGDRISYSRGNITVLDRRGLEAAACQCYEVVKVMHEGVPARAA